MLGQDHYIHRLRASCIAQPEYHRHLLPALDRELEFVRAASTPEQHLEASGYMIGLARAEALDRAANEIDIAVRHDDPWIAAAAGIDYVHAQKGASHVELYTSIQEGHQRAAPLRAQSAEIHAAFTRLFLNLLHVHTSNFELGPAYAEIDSSFRILRNNDPAFLPDSWLDPPRYSLRLPWRNGLLHEWLAPYWDMASAPPPIPPAPSFLLPPLPACSAGWPSALPLDTPPDTTLADVYLHRQAEWPDDALASHWRITRALLLAASSPIAQQAVSVERHASFSVLATRNMLALSALLAPSRATANHGWEQTEESLAGIGKANVTIKKLTGQSPEQIHDSPRVQHFLTHNLAPRLIHGCEGFGALAGEAGFDLLRHASAWQSAAT